MKIGIVHFAAAFFLGATSISSAMAFESTVPSDPLWADDVETTDSIGDRGNISEPFYDACPESSAAEGNANQQSRAVKQYGQTSGGYRC